MTITIIKYRQYITENCQNNRINSINELYHLSKLQTKVLICVSQN